MMSAVRAMFLHLEHHNEAMLRVSLEIVTCPEASKCLRWDDEWFSNDAQREAFRETILEKSKLAQYGDAAHIKNSSEDVAGDAHAKRMSSGQAGDDLKRALDECQEAQEETADCKARIAELQAEVTRLRTSLRASMRDTFMVDSHKGRQLSDISEGGPQDWSKQRPSTSGSLQGERYQDSTKIGESNGKKHFCDAEAQCLVQEVNAAVDAGALELICSECRETSRKLNICKAQLAQAHNGAISADTQACGEHIAAAETNKLAASEKASKLNKKKRTLITGDEDSITGDAFSREAGMSLESSWADKSSELERTKKKLGQRDVEIAELKERMHGMSRTLFQLKQSLHKLKEIAEARGFGRLVKEAMEECSVNKILEDPEYPIFTRLYQDALRRQDKAKLRDQQILGSSSSSPGLLAAVRPPSRLQAGGHAERQADSNVAVQSRPGTPTRLLEGNAEGRTNFLNPVNAARPQPAMSAMMLDLQPSDSKTTSSSSPRDQIVVPFSEKWSSLNVELPFSEKSAVVGLEHHFPRRSSSTPNLKSQGKRMLERKGLPGVRSGLPCLLGGPSLQGKLIPEQLKASRRHWPSNEMVDFQQSKTLSVDWQTDMAPLCGRPPLVTVSLCADSEARR